MMLIKCAPDHDGCIDLLAVLRIMNQIDQEQAWALAYQLAALMQRLWPAGNNCATIESLAQIYINQEGFVHEKSLQLAPGAAQEVASSASNMNTQEEEELEQESRIPQTAEKLDGVHRESARGGATAAATAAASLHHQKLPPTPPITPELNEQLQRRQRASSESELVASLGIALFWALDYGIPDDEERKLGRTMEFLIVQSQKGLSLDELEQICIKRLPVATKCHADLHYQTICKALIADTIELSILLDKIYTATMVMNGSPPTVGQIQGAQTTNNNNNHNHKSDIMADYLHHNHQHSHKSNNNNHRLHNHHHQHRDQQTNYLNHHLLQIDQDDLSELGLPLASLRALKVNDWARLWMQVIRELRQRRKFIHQQQQHQQQQQYENEHAELQTV